MESLDIILQDLSAAYSSAIGAENAELKEAMQFSEFASWQEKQQGETLRAETESFWLEQFLDGLPALELPTDRLRPPIKTYPCMQQRSVIDSKSAAAEANSHRRICPVR